MTAMLDFEWSHKVTAGSLEIWTSNVPEFHATVEYYDRMESHWSVIQKAVRNHGSRGPVLLLTGPELAAETSCRGVFVISHPAMFTIAVTSIDLGGGRSALVQMYKAGNDWADTDYEPMLELAVRNADLVVDTASSGE